MDAFPTFRYYCNKKDLVLRLVMAHWIKQWCSLLALPVQFRHNGSSFLIHFLFIPQTLDSRFPLKDGLRFEAPCLVLFRVKSLGSCLCGTSSPFLLSTIDDINSSVCNLLARLETLVENLSNFYFPKVSFFLCVKKSVILLDNWWGFNFLGRIHTTKWGFCICTSPYPAFLSALQ